MVGKEFKAQLEDLMRKRNQFGPLTQLDDRGSYAFGYDAPAPAPVPVPVPLSLQKQQDKEILIREQEEAELKKNFLPESGYESFRKSKSSRKRRPVGSDEQEELVSHVYAPSGKPLNPDTPFVFYSHKAHNLSDKEGYKTSGDHLAFKADGTGGVVIDVHGAIDPYYQRIELKDTEGNRTGYLEFSSDGTEVVLRGKAIFSLTINIHGQRVHFPRELEEEPLINPKKPVENPLKRKRGDGDIGDSPSPEELLQQAKRKLRTVSTPVEGNPALQDPASSRNFQDPLDNRATSPGADQEETEFSRRAAEIRQAREKRLAKAQMEQELSALAQRLRTEAGPRSAGSVTNQGSNFQDPLGNRATSPGADQEETEFSRRAAEINQAWGERLTDGPHSAIKKQDVAGARTSAPVNNTRISTGKSVVIRSDNSSKASTKQSASTPESALSKHFQSFKEQNEAKHARALMEKELNQFVQHLKQSKSANPEIQEQMQREFAQLRNTIEHNPNALPSAHQNVTCARQHFQDLINSNDANPGNGLKK